MHALSLRLLKGNYGIMETLKFNELNISPEIFRGVKDMGFEEASPIQSKAIPIAMTGADIIEI